MSLSVLSLLFSNLFLIVGVFFYNLKFDQVLFIYTLEIFLIFVSKSIKLLYLIFVRKIYKYCILLFIFGIFAFVVISQVTNYLLLNYRYFVNQGSIIFILTFFLSHLLSLKTNFFEKVQKKQNVEDFLTSLYKLANRVRVVSLISLIGWFFTYTTQGTYNQSLYLVIPFCILKTYFDLQQHKIEHELKNSQI